MHDEQSCYTQLKDIKSWLQSVLYRLVMLNKNSYHQYQEKKRGGNENVF